MIGDCVDLMNTGIPRLYATIGSEIGNDKQTSALNLRSDEQYSIDEAVGINTKTILYLLKKKYVTRRIGRHWAS